MSFNAGELFVLLGAKVDQAAFARYEASLARTKASAERVEAANARMSRSMQVAGTVAKTGLAAGIGAVALAAGKAIKTAADFESELSNFKAVTKATDREMQQLSGTAKKLGEQSGLGARATVRAATELAKGGLTVKQVLGGALKGALDLAQAGAMDLSAAGETVANALNLFGLSGEKATHVADALATAANGTTADVSDFAIALQQAGGAARIAGLDFDDTITALEALALAGVKGSDAGTSLKTMLTQVGKPTKESAEAMKQLGLSFFDAQGNFKSLPALADNMRKAFGDLTRQQFLNKTATIGGTDALRALYAIYKQGPEGIRRLQDGLAKQGTAADVAREKTDNLRGSWHRFTATLENIAIDAGTPALEKLTGGLQDLTKAMQDARRGQGDLAQLAGDLRDVGRAAGEIGDTFNIGGMLSGLVSGTVGVFGGLARTISAILRGDIAGAIRGAQGAIRGAFEVALVAPAGAAARTLVQPFRTAVGTIVGLVGSMMHGIGGAIGSLSGLPGVGGWFKALSQEIDAAGDQLGTLAEQIKGIKPVKASVQIDAQEALANIARVRGEKIANKVARILGEDTDARTKVAKLQQLKLDAKTARLLADASGALRGVQTAKGAISTLRDRTVNVAVVAHPVGFDAVRSAISALQMAAASIQASGPRAPRPSGGARRPGNAMGRGPDGAQVSLVGEGAGPEWVGNPVDGWRLADGPQITALAAGDFVIPTERRYAGRALGLLADAFGIEAFAKGRKGKPKRKRAPKRVLPARPSNFRLSDPQDLADDIHRLEGVKDDRKQGKNGRRGPLTKRAMEARRELAVLRPLYAKAKREADRIKALEEDAANEYAAMELFDKRNDQRGYDSALTAYRGRLGAEKGRLEVIYAALVKAKRQDTAWGRAVRGRLLEVGGKIEDAQVAQSSAQSAAAEAAAQAAQQETEADRFADTGLTDAERARQSELERDVSLAALTKGTGDDQAAATAVEKFFSGVLGADLAGRNIGGQLASADAVRELADRVKSARESLDSFNGTGTNENADLQAQIDQERARRQTVEDSLRAQTDVLRALTGPGDIGTGRFSTAGAAAQIVQNNYMLHPADPSVLRAVGGAAARGFGLQTGSVNPVGRSGL